MRPASTPVGASATAPAVARPVTASAVDYSSELPLLTASEERFDAGGPTSASLVDLDGGWTPVSRRTSRTHRERHISSNRNDSTDGSASESNSSDYETESTIARATNDMSSEHLDALVRRHEAISTQYRAALLARTPVSNATHQSKVTQNEGNLPSVDKARRAFNPVRESTAYHPVTMEEVEDEDDYPYLNQAPLSHAILEDAEDLIDLDSRVSKAGARKRSKSPKSKKIRTREEAPQHALKVDEPPIVAAPVKPAAKVEFTNLGLQKPEGSLPALGRDVEHEREPKPSLSIDEIVALVTDKVIELQVRQAQHRDLHANGARDSTTAGYDPGRMAALNFFEKALQGASSSSPDDPSDDSSSESDVSSHHSGHGDHGSSRRGASSPRLSSKRKRGHERKKRMILKPIPPTRYNGEPDANAIQRFARESTTYVKMGRVPHDQQAFALRMDLNEDVEGEVPLETLDASSEESFDLISELNSLHAESDDSWDAETIGITHTDHCKCIYLPRRFLRDPAFDLEHWFDNATAHQWTEGEMELGESASRDGWSSVLSSLTSSSESTDPPSLQAVSESASEASMASTAPPSLQSVSDSSESDSGDLVMPGDDGETYEDRMKLWANILDECCNEHNYREVPPRARRLGDVLGNMQYFMDVGLWMPMFNGVGIGKIPREPDDLEGPDEYLISIPLGGRDLHEQISEETLLNPSLDLVGWLGELSPARPLRKYVQAPAFLW
ncbi:hypothetical protein C8R44DRAFT_904960 [Mycena epipterygia]|nr:hypothetical protein C8R44DRAFT_904960 [Mycena epipterygia]